MTPITINDEDAIRLVEELAALEGESTVKVVMEAVQEKLQRLRAPDDQEHGLAEQLMALAKRSAPLWDEPHLSTRHGDLLYDDSGLPR